MAELRIGTSGWAYPHWRGVLYPHGVPQRRWLEHYAAEFDTVELNVTFYRLPAQAVFSGWRERTPQGFLFAVKAPRVITHHRKLADCAAEAAEFLSRANRLGERLGPLLVQLPPRWPCDAARLEGFLGALPEGVRFAFEFRDESWLREDVYSLLQARNMAVVRVSAQRFPEASTSTADFRYLRMHGDEQTYSSKYSQESLARWADYIAEWVSDKRDVFVYFNNDAHGYAVEDARRLREMVGEQC